MAGPDLTAPIPRAEANDIQGLVRTGYGDLPEARFLLLHVADAPAARRWLGAQIDKVARADRQVRTALQIAITAAGLRTLHIPPDVLSGFAPEFLTGMAGDPGRSRRLGDVGANDPALWRWGGAQAPHMLLMLYAETDLDWLQASITTADFHAGFTIAQTLQTQELAGKEPFGFADGISQPLLDWDLHRTPGTRADLDFGNLISAGEVLLGYSNEYGLYTDRPLLDPTATGAAHLPRAAEDPTRADLGRNGTYLVLRELHQDVLGFWRFLATQAGDQAVALAETMVGRRMDGTALMPIQDAAIPGIDAKHHARNHFTYDQDQAGLCCPIGAHIRRANPRTGDMPPGDRGLLARLIRMLGFGKPDLKEDLIAATRFHRLLRRGRPFGRLLSPEEAMDQAAPDPQAGLYFMCLNANIARQFEFVQNAWMVSAKFAGLSGEADPLLGNRLEFSAGQATNAFGIPQPNGVCRYVANLPQFVTTRGGEYFFLPGIRALRYIASLA
jgi:deferrochelatase/peroxidase EfeB